MKIMIKGTTMVKPMTAKANTTIWMSNLDALLDENNHALTVYFYRSTCTGADDFFSPKLLKEALSRALDDFYPVAGRLKKDENGRIEINCNGEGALFVEAEGDGDLNELGDFKPKPEIGLIPNVDYSQGISSFPLFLVQVTRFTCGGVCLGTALDHHAADGISGVHFINSWAEIARGLDITIPPLLDRTVLSARSPPQAHFIPSCFLPPPQLNNPQHNISSESIFSVFKITREQLNALKAKCKEEDEEISQVTYTTYEALAGHAWRCVSMARGLPKDQETMAYLPVNGRPRLRPKLSVAFFGNVVVKATSVTSCGELESKPLKYAVGKIHEALARMDDEYLRAAIDYLEMHHELDQNLRSTRPFKSPNLGIVSWANMPIYDADFGWGRPIYFGVGVATTPGYNIVLPSPCNDGSLLYAISLPKEQVQVFEKLFYHI